MFVFLGVLILALFLFGLVQWARSGAILWTLLSLKKDARPENFSERVREDVEIRKAERMMDQLLRSSFKVIGILALGMWLFLGATILLDLLGIDWIDRISVKARTFWGAPAYNRSPGTTTHNTKKTKRRDNILKSLGDSLRR